MHAAIHRPAVTVLELAQHQAGRAHEGDAQHQLATSLGAILSAAISVESKVFDTWVQLIEPPLRGDSGAPVGRYVLPGALQAALAQLLPLDSPSVAADQRLAVLFRHVFRAGLDRGAEPIASWIALRKLRNALAHFRPTWSTKQSREADYEEKSPIPKGLLDRVPELRTSAGIDEISGVPPAFPMVALTAPVANWSAKTAKQMFDFVDEAESYWANNGYRQKDFYDRHPDALPGAPEPFKVSDRLDLGDQGKPSPDQR